jgi:hypothetical protein
MNKIPLMALPKVFKWASPIHASNLQNAGDSVYFISCPLLQVIEPKGSFEMKPYIPPLNDVAG